MRATLRDRLRRKNAQVGVDVVDGAAVDADRRQHAAVIAHAAQILARLAVLPEDRAAAIAALDGPTIQVVPLIHPAHGSCGRLLLVEFGDRFAERHFAQQRERSVENAAIVCSGDDGVSDSRR